MKAIISFVSFAKINAKQAETRNLNGVLVFDSLSLINLESLNS